MTSGLSGTSVRQRAHRRSTEGDPRCPRVHWDFTHSIQMSLEITCEPLEV